MKRIISLAVAGAMLLGSVCTASALEVKPKGVWEFVFGWTENSTQEAKGGGNFLDAKHGGPNYDNFEARQRARIGADIVVSEQLVGHIMFELGEIYWGQGRTNPGKGAGGSLDGDGVNIETKHAYLSWMIPGTEAQVRMGLQTVALPSFANGFNPIFNTDATGIVVNVPVMDELGITAFWVRAFDTSGNDGYGSSANKHDEADYFALMLPITVDGMKITPWGMFATLGADSGYWGYHRGGGYWGTQTSMKAPHSDSTIGWAAGISYALTMFDPLTFKIDAAYSMIQGKGGNNSKTMETKGWFIDAALNYKMDFGTAGLFGWYASGDDKDAIKDNEYGRAAIFADDGGFGPTTFGFDGSGVGISNDNVVSNTGVGTWGIGVEMANMSFIDDLSHTIRVAYYMGTNDSKLVKNNPGSFSKRMNNVFYLDERAYMTDKDYAIEVNFDHKYQIYENLAAFLELGYVHMDYDKKTWKNTDFGHKTDDAWKAQLAFQFKF